MANSGFIIVVSGLPRSGTSMMMRMLHAGGIQVVSDNERKADVDNPKGYFEFEKAKKLRQDSSWIPEVVGKAFKLVSLLLEDLPEGYSYRVVFMRRDIEEMLDSQEKMLKRLGKNDTSGGRDQMRAIYENHLAHIDKWLSGQAGMEVLYVNFRDVINEPERLAREVNDFLGGSLDTEAMAGMVDPSLYRNRVEG